MKVKIQQFVQEVYVDESYNDDTFVLSLCTAHPDSWRNFRILWTAFLEETNERLAKEGRRFITRYHATDCAHKKREFEGWTENEQIDFTQRLIEILLCCPLHCVSICVLAKDVQSACAQVLQVRLDAKSCLRACYFIAAQIAADVLTQIVHGINPQMQFRLTFDQGPEGQMILLALEHLKSILSARFASISHVHEGDSRSCIPLQASDFLAYESFKERDREINRPSMMRRKSFRALLAGGIGLSLRTVERDFIREVALANSAVLTDVS